MNKESITNKTIKDFNKMAASNEMVEEPQRCYPILMEKIKDDDVKILDVGCGLGQILELISDKKKGNCELFGIDLTPGMVLKSRERLGDRAQIVEGDVENMPYEDGQFDLVLCMHSFHHYPFPQKAMDELYRVLSPGGRLMLVDNNLPPFKRFMYNLRQKVTFYHKGDIRFYSFDEMLSLAANSKFSESNCTEITKKSFLLECKK